MLLSNVQLHPFLRTILSFLRIQTYLVITLQLFLSIGFVSYYSSIEFGSLLQNNFVNLLACLICTASWYINATAINDLSDFEIDKINLKQEKDRPLVSGDVNKKTVWYVAAIFACFGVMVGLYISWHSAVLMAIMIILNWIYSMLPIRISYRGGLAQMLLPLGYVVLPFSLGMFAFSGIWNLQSVSIMTALYLMFCSRVLLKDFRDVKGDKVHGKMTFLLRHSVQTVAMTGLLVYIMGVVIISVLIAKSPAPYLNLPILFLAGIEMLLFFELSKTKIWKEQRPLLAPLGRLNTAQLLLLLLATLTNSESMSLFSIGILASLITIVFSWSAYVSLKTQTLRS